jgi:hypothetical protein
MEGQNLALLDQLANQLKAQTDAARNSMVTFTSEMLLYLRSRYFCGARYKAVYIDKSYTEEPDIAQRRKDLFRYVAFGILDSQGNVPDLPKIRGGKASADEKRIRQQASALRDHLDAHQIVVTDAAVPVEYVYAQYILIHDRFDVLCERVTPDGEVEYLVLQPTVTSSISNTYGESCWGNYWLMDHTRAFLQAGMQQALTGKPYQFMYAVYEYSASLRHDFIRITVDALRKSELNEAIQKAFKKHHELARENFPASGVYEACSSCPVEGCPSRVKIKPIKDLI